MGKEYREMEGKSRRPGGSADIETRRARDETQSRRYNNELSKIEGKRQRNRKKGRARI